MSEKGILIEERDNILELHKKNDMRKRILKLVLLVEAVYLTVRKCKHNTHAHTHTQRLMQLIHCRASSPTSDNLVSKHPGKYTMTLTDWESWDRTGWSACQENLLWPGAKEKLREKEGGKSDGNTSRKAGWQETSPGVTVLLFHSNLTAENLPNTGEITCRMKSYTFINQSDSELMSFLIRGLRIMLVLKKAHPSLS